jgi:uncharacterized protein
MNENIAKEVYETGFSPITISIDGPHHIHNQRRFYKNKEGSFDDVIAGINNITKYQEVILRINIDKANYTHYENFLNELNEFLKFKNNIVIYIKPVTTAWKYDFDKKTMFDGNDFFDIEKEFIETTKRHNFKLKIHPGFEHWTRCIAYQIGSHLIDAELQLFKCPLHIGHAEERVGYIDHNGKIIIERDNTCVKYTNLSPFDIEECKNCRVLPLCNGKCPVVWEQFGRQINQGCIPEKETIIRKIESFLLPEYIRPNA